MPRDGSGIYTYPAGTPGVTNATISSAKYNGYIDDVQSDLNAARPIVAGGTGATSAAVARTNLQAERAGANVTNYADHVFEAGSFWSNPNTTGEPETGKYTSGICHKVSDAVMVLDAYVWSTVDGIAYNAKYTKIKWSTWSPWYKQANTLAASSGEGIVATTGDMWFGVRETAPGSYFAVNSESDLSGTNLFAVLKSGGAISTSWMKAEGGVYYFDAAATKYISHSDNYFNLIGGNGVYIAATTASSDPDSGALVVEGGVGIGGNIFTAGGLELVNGTANSPRVIFSASGYHQWHIDNATGDFRVLTTYAGGVVQFYMNYTSGQAHFPLTTASSSPSTGALVVAGGAGIGGALYAAGVVSSLPSGDAYVQCRVGGNIYGSFSANAGATYFDYQLHTIFREISGGYATRAFLDSTKFNVSFTTPSTSSSTGALVVEGGVGIAGALYVAGSIRAQGANADVLIHSYSGNPPRLWFYHSGGSQNFIQNDGNSFAFFSNGAGSTGMYILQGASAWNALSDARMPYKRTAREITDRLPPLDHYHLYENENASGIPEVFAKAQEFDALFPQLVHRGSDDPDYEPTGMGDQQAWGMSYDRMGAIALAYIKQHAARLDAIERQQQERH